MSFEGEEDLDIEFGDIVPCDCSESSYGHENTLVELDFTASDSVRGIFGDDHFGESEDSRVFRGTMMGQGRVNGGSAE